MAWQFLHDSARGIWILGRGREERRESVDDGGVVGTDGKRRGGVIGLLNLRVEEEAAKFWL